MVHRRTRSRWTQQAFWWTNGKPLLAASAFFAAAVGVLNLPTPRPTLRVPAQPDTIRSVSAGPRHRPAYKFSVVRGGVYSPAEVLNASASDSVVRTHYAGLQLARMKPQVLQEDSLRYVSFRKGGNVFWTSKRVRMPKGEMVLTEGGDEVRARCGNRLSSVPQTPVIADKAAEPTEEDLTSHESGDADIGPAAVAASPANVVTPQTFSPPQSDSPVRQQANEAALREVLGIPPHGHSTYDPSLLHPIGTGLLPPHPPVNTPTMAELLLPPPPPELPIVRPPQMRPDLTLVVAPQAVLVAELVMPAVPGQIPRTAPDPRTPIVPIVVSVSTQTSQPAVPPAELTLPPPTPPQESPAPPPQQPWGPSPGGGTPMPPPPPTTVATPEPATLGSSGAALLLLAALAMRRERRARRG